MGNVTSSVQTFLTEGNRYARLGRITMSNSYATGGDAYTVRGLGLGVLEHLELDAAGGFIPQWNSAANTIVVSRIGGGGGPSGGLTVIGPGTTAGVVLNVANQPSALYGGSAYTGFSFLSGPLINLYATGASALVGISTGATGVTLPITELGTGGFGFLRVLASTSGTLFTTAATDLRWRAPMSDGGFLPFTAGTTASTFIVLYDAAAGAGAQIKTTLAVNIIVSVDNQLGFGIKEIASGTDLSTSGANVVFRYRAVGS